MLYHHGSPSLFMTYAAASSLAGFACGSKVLIQYGVNTHAISQHEDAGYPLGDTKTQRSACFRVFESSRLCVKTVARVQRPAVLTIYFSVLKNFVLRPRRPDWGSV